MLIDDIERELLTSEQLHGAWNGVVDGILYGFLGSSLGVACLIHGASRQKTRLGSFWPFILALCEVAEPSIVVELVVVAIICELLKVDLVSENGSDTTKAFDELVTLTGSVRHELQLRTKVLVGFRQPLQEGGRLDDFHLTAGLLVLEQLTVAFLGLRGVQDDLRTSGILQNPAGDVQVLEDDQSLGGTELQSLEGILDTVANLAGILGDLLEVLADQLLLLDELDAAQGLSCQLDGLVETVLATVGNVDNLDDLGLQTLVEHIGLVQVVLEVGGTSQDETGDVDLVVGNVVLDSQFGDLTNVVVTLFLTKTGETQSGLTTTTL